MNSPQLAEQQIRKECQKLVEDVILYILTVPGDWRYRGGGWDIGQANSLKAYIKRNTAYLFNMMQDNDYSKNFDVPVTEDEDEEYYEAQNEINNVFYAMFPIVGCLHGDDIDDLKSTFTPRLEKIHSMFK